MKKSKSRILSETNSFDYSQFGESLRTKIYVGDVFDENCLAIHAIRKARKTLGLSAVLTIDNQPAVYFKEVIRKDFQAESYLHKKLWNHGTANILVVIDPSEVRFYSAFVPPTEDIVDDNDSRIIETLSRDAFILQEFVVQVATGTYYQKYHNHFDSKTGVDQFLLNNLTETTNRLKSTGLTPIFAHTLIGCVLFLFYLWDRKIINSKMFPAKLGFHSDIDLRDFLTKKSVSADIINERLFAIFKIIQEKFNGSLFGNNLEKTREKITSKHIAIIQEMIDGKTEISTGQSYLFRMYDFEMIPIETISAIYESFLLGDDTRSKGDKGVFYTPRYLAELTVDVATENWDTLLNKKYLDPACGSGIFLVIIFNRMADEWRARNPKAKVKTRLNAMRNFLIENLYGIDIFETSTLITCFSLYLAFLNQMETRDIDELQELLNAQQKNEKILPPLLGKTIHPKNFFEYNSDDSFDLVIGNPPWTGRNHPVDGELIKWVASDGCPFKGRFGKSQKDNKNIFFPNEQSVIGFLWKSLCHISDTSRVCLLTPTKTLLNKNVNDFQKAWLSEVVVERIVQLADFRFTLFENAQCPATIIRFNSNKEQIENNTVIHDTPKVSRDDPRQSYITIHADDRKIVAQSELQIAANKNQIGRIWKRFFWGTDRDQRLLDRLEQWSNKTIQDVIDDKKWVSGQGFQPFYGSKSVKSKERLQPDSYKYIGAKDKKLNDLVLIENELSTIDDEFKILHRNRDERIFESPLILINQGFTASVYSDFPVLFQHSLQSIACNNDKKSDKELLLFLCGVLNTPLVQYYCFHTSANQGVERDKVLFHELKRLPFPQPNDFANPKEKLQLVRDVAKCILDTKNKIERENNIFDRTQKIDEAKKTIKKYVYEYYEIAAWEEKLIDDTTKIFAPSATPVSLNSKKIRTLDSSNRADRKNYADLFCNAINTWCRRAKVKLNGETRIAKRLGLALFILNQETEKKEYTESETTPDELFHVLQMINESLKEVTGKRLLTQKRYVHFEEDRAYIIKPLELRYWTQTAALNDADEFFAIMFNARYGGEK